jgi:hypothetical protein
LIKYLITILLVALGPAFILNVFLELKRRYHNKKVKAPFTENFLRSPGETLIRQLQNLNEEINSAQISIVFFPLYLIFTLLIMIKSTGTNQYAGKIIITCAIIIFSGYYIRKTWKLIEQRRILRLGYEGEVAAGQELNQLMLDGYNVFHDFQADKFNIDHIIVGPDAVYAVETKTRSKSRGKGRGNNYKVISDGKTLQFPDYTSSEFIDQADRQARWLQKWLSSAAGETATVKPVVLLPGWYVEIVKPDGVPVLNPKMVRQFLVNKEKILPQSLRTRIAHQVEQKCRDIEPETVRNEKIRD